MMSQQPRYEAQQMPEREPFTEQWERDKEQPVTRPEEPGDPEEEEELERRNEP